MATPPSAQRIVAGLKSGSEEQREAACVQLEALSDAVFASATAGATAVPLAYDPSAEALECIGPLVEHVIAADTSVGLFQRACLILSGLYAMDPPNVGQDHFRHSRFNDIWNSPNYTAVFAK